ncbi:MAG TPA: LCP family protein [Streptosporangiaceae bacterium]|nr:LCP family protein [Streptosporangiaceae bacterium]
MSNWDGWYRDGGGQSGRPAAGGPSDPTVSAYPPGTSRSASGRPGPGGAWPDQPPERSTSRGRGSQPAGRPGGRPGGTGRGYPGGPGTGRRWLRPRRIFGVLGIVIAAILVASVGFYFYLNSKLTRSDVLAAYSGRPAVSAGTNWLITGSDSRQGLTSEQERQLATGSLSAAAGQRSDTILVLHIPANGGRPVLVSLPRDSYVPIPGHGSSKINAAFDIGGPQLLAQTVQNVTGLYINHYMGIGFGGFVNVVNAVGGVRMCLPGPMVDPKAGLNLKAGCQNLDGDQALGYVRTRNFAISDIQREQDQRLFMKALLSKMTSTGVLLNPFASIPAATGSASTLTVDQGTSLYQLVQAAFALRNPQTTTVPLASLDFQTPNDGTAVLWNRSQALELFNDLKTDTKVPHRLLSGSKAAPTG